MFNVLPDIFKKEVIKDYKLRRLLVILLFIISLQILLLILIFPSWIISAVKEKEITSQKLIIDNLLATQNTEAVFSFITKTNSKLKILDTVLTYPKILPLVQSILANKSGGITIDEFSYTARDEKNASILIIGTSSTREALLKFVKNLENAKTFEKVDSPVSNFTKDKNINFSITLNIVQ